MDLDKLFIIARHSEDGAIFDLAKSYLKEHGHITLSEALAKLQEDVGQAINLAFNPDDVPVPGLRAEEIARAYEEVTDDRLVILLEICKVMPEIKLRRWWIDSLLGDLGLNFNSIDEPGQIPAP